MELSGGVATPGLFRPHHYTVAERLQGFGLSALESFPELFGIRPSLETEQYRADNPVSGFLSQMVGAFVPYVGAAKALRAVPLLRSGIVAMEALGGENAIARGALGAMAEAGMTEAGRLALSATPVPGALYSGLTGRDGGLIRARKLRMVDQNDPSKEHDIGQVGDITRIDPAVVKALQDDQFIPVVSPIGFGEANESYNINADVVASRLAT